MGSTGPVVNNRFAAAVSGKYMGGTYFVLRSFMKWTCASDYDVVRRGATRCLIEERKDARILDRVGLRVEQDTNRNTEWNQSNAFSGIDQRAGEVGAVATALLHSLIYGAKRNSVVPNVTMVKGH